LRWISNSPCTVAPASSASTRASSRARCFSESRAAREIAKKSQPMPIATGMTASQGRGPFANQAATKMPAMTPASASTYHRVPSALVVELEWRKRPRGRGSRIRQLPAGR
jgi:hypothetical protein